MRQIVNNLARRAVQIGEKDLHLSLQHTATRSVAWRITCIEILKTRVAAFMDVISRDIFTLLPLLLSSIFIYNFHLNEKRGEGKRKVKRRETRWMREFSMLRYCKFPPQFSHAECVIQCAHSRRDVFINGTQT